MSTFAAPVQPGQASQSPDVSSTSPSDSQANSSQATNGEKKASKRRKVNHACLYCRRSHMTCDEGRPCQRCIKREIGHLCHDERRPKHGDKPSVQSGPGSNGEASKNPTSNSFASLTSNSTWPMSLPQSSYLYRPDTLGNEFSVLTDFLETLDDPSFFTPPTTVAPSLMSSSTFPSSNNTDTALTRFPTSQSQPAPESTTSETPLTTSASAAKKSPETTASVLPAATKTERFLLTAADQESGSRDERLNRVIRSKYEAGLLKPYNYVKGYARLSRWMERNVSQESKQQILQPLSVLRPKFRAVAQSLRDIDLVFIEEAFERLLLDYDRVFSAMGVPACLWRRTGEIYKANREFAELVGLDGIMMREGRICIYELMAEESAVNYWEKYGHVAFDSSQKAVLTSCVLRYKPNLNYSPSTPGKVAKPEKETPTEEGLVSCCFSFTIRRDKWGIPTMIVGNFIKC